MTPDAFAQFWFEYVELAPGWVVYGLYFFLVQFVVFWATNLPFILLYFECFPTFVLNWAEKYKLNSKKKMPKADFWKVVKRVLLIQFALSLPIIMFKPQEGVLSILPRDTASLPSWKEMTVHILAFMLIEDTVFYWMHRLFHVGKLYQMFHSIHHEVHYTISLAALYFHPLEYVLGVAFPVLLGPLLLRTHMLTLFIWVSLMTVESILAHSGYDFPFYFLVDGREHAYHHSHFKNNYGAWFTVWDKLLGTDRDYKAYISKKHQNQQ